MRKFRITAWQFYWPAWWNLWPHYRTYTETYMPNYTIEGFYFSFGPIQIEAMYYDTRSG